MNTALAHQAEKDFDSRQKCALAIRYAADEMRELTNNINRISLMIKEGHFNESVCLEEIKLLSAK
jgi:hypothetical protein